VDGRVVFSDVVRGDLIATVLVFFISSQSGRIPKLFHIEKDSDGYLYFLVFSLLSTSPVTSSDSSLCPALKETGAVVENC
jgi:hypothetical protein